MALRRGTMEPLRHQPNMWKPEGGEGQGKGGMVTMLCPPCARMLTHISSMAGLSGVPTDLVPLREGLGLAGEQWDALGPRWHSLASTWLRAETALHRSGKPDLTYKEIKDSSLPDDWKDWMYNKLMRVDNRGPSDSWPQCFTEYLQTLSIAPDASNHTFFDEPWVRSGRTGIIGLVNGLNWQALHFAAGPDWESNVAHVESLFHAILELPEL